MTTFNPGANFDLSAFVAKREKSEVRVDPEKEIALGKIIEMLLASGYFRARLQGLTAFDKVLGGLAWAIVSSAVSVDVDVWFDDDSTLGEKNRCAEDVCSALIRMGCPHRLESFQITRSDWKSVYPVVQWLIKTVLETRDETAAKMRAYAEREFEQTATHPVDEAFAEKRDVVSERLDELASAFAPKRRFKRTRRTRESNAERVANVLKEYGELGGSGAVGESGGQASELGEGYAAWQGQDNVDGSVVGGILGLQKGAIRHYRSLYDQQKGDGMLTEAQIAERMRQQKIASHEARLEQGSAEVAKMKAQHEKGAAMLAAMQQQLDNKKKENEAIEQGIARFNELMKDPEKAKQVQELLALVSLNESLKNQLSDFELSCRRQTAELKAKIEAMRGATDDDETKYVKKVDAMYQDAKQKEKKLRALVARKNRTILLIQRKIDEVPTQSELSQYNREFVQLYEQVATRFMETRQHFNTFNMLDDQRIFLSRETNIMKDLREQYPIAMKSRKGKEALVKSMTEVVDSVIKSKDNAMGKLEEEKAVRDELKQKFIALLEKQRQYAQLTKEFQELASKHAELRKKHQK